MLHLFDSKGKYLSSEHWYGGTTANCDANLMQEKLESMVAALGKVEYCDVEIELFQTFIDGHVFGLVPDEESGMIELQPSSTIAFGEPWDGEYDT